MLLRNTRLLLIFFFIASAHASFGQTIKGQLLNSKGDAAEFMNVLLLQLPDSAVAKLELSDEDGKYRFTKVEKGEYFIKVTGIGVEDNFSENFIVGDDHITLPVIRMSEFAQELETVEVTAKKPLLEQRAGRLVVNVDQSITGKGGSVTDLLRKVPGLIVINDRVSMAGKSGVTILIDGRPTKYMDIESLLREMPADNIEKIEVISQPGAAFDAEGTGGVINIILKKNTLLGTNGSVSAGFGYGEVEKYRASVSLNHRTGPWNLSAYAGYNRSNWQERLDLVRTLPDVVYDQVSTTPGRPNSGRVRLGADYAFNDQHKTGLTVSAAGGINNRTGTNTTRILDREGQLLSSFTNLNVQDRDWRSVTADAFYQWKIDTFGQKFTIDANYASYNRNAMNDLIVDDSDIVNRRNQEPAETKIYSAQMDYTLPLGKTLQFQAGVKASLARLDNELKASMWENNTWINDVTRSNQFLFDEDIYAAYVNLSYSRDSWEANVGLRYEQSISEGYSVTIDSTVNRAFRNVFPSVNFVTPLAGDLGLSFAYSYRIERPDYYDLNPFVIFLDPFTFQQGNPFLVPEYTHSGQFSVTYDKQPFFNLTYDITNDVLTEVTEQNDETGEAFQTNVNLDRYIKYGGSLFFPLDFIAKPVSGYGGVMIFYHDYQSDYLGGEFLQDQTSVTGFLQANIKLPDDWKMEVVGWLQGAGLDGIIRYETFYGVNAGLEKKFLDDRLRVQMSADGIVQKFFHGSVNYQNMNFQILSAWEAPVFRLNLNWKFGNRYLKDRENRRSASEAERNRVQQN